MMNGRISQLAGLFGLLLLMLIIGWEPQANATADSTSPPHDNPLISSFIEANDKGLDEAVVASLLEKVTSQGEVLVIVGLDLPQSFRVEGTLDSPAAVAQQRNAIQQTQDGLLGELAGYQAEAYRVYETVPAMALRVDAKAFDILRQSPLVNHIQEDEAVPHTLASSTAVIGAPAVWAQGYEGTGQAVVIIDTGIDGDHPFFGDRIVAEACFSNGNGVGTSLCPNGQNTQIGSGAAEVKIPACLDGAIQLCNHGSHVAGIAAGEGVDFDGVARNADIIAIQVFTRFDNDVLSSWSDILAALDYVDSTLRPVHTIASINMSLGVGSYTSACDDNVLKPAIDSLRSVGIATVIATGNDYSTGAIGSPACISTAIAVGSTTDVDAVSDFSNVHDMMHLFAPGSAIESAVAGGGFANFNGTSMAAPHVAGAWAVLKQVNPTATVDEVLAVLVNTGVMVTDTRPGGTVTKPRIQLDLAVNAGYLTGMVTDGVNPLEGALISAANITTTYSTQTDASGIYTTVIPMGSYDVTASLFGYLPQTVNNVTIISGTMTAQDFVLTQIPTHTVTGVVTDATTGWPLYASIEIVGSPHTIWTDPVDGSYSVVLPEGITYTLNVNAWVAGYETVMREVGPLTSNETEDFGLVGRLHTNLAVAP